MNVTPSILLRRGLWADAAISGGAGALQLVGGDSLAAAFGLWPPLVAGTGWFLLAYGGLLVWLVTRVRLHGAWLALIVVGNLGWTLACAMLWMSGVVAASALGWAWIGVQGLATLVFAIWQFAGWRTSSPAPGGGLDLRIA